MPPDKILDALETVILNRTLNPSERQVLLQSFQGHSYSTISQETSYVSGYLRVVGARLWQELSQVLGQKVTKKNIHSLIVSYLQSDSHIKVSLHDAFGSAPEPSTLDGLGHTENVLTTDTHPFPSGPLPLNSPFYIQRPPLEQRAYQAIEHPGCLLRLKAPRRYGKSSLLLRILAQANTLGFKTVVLDFQDADHPILGDLERLLRWFCANIARQLGLSVDINNVWDDTLGSKVSCKAFLHEHILPEVTQPLLIALNEVNQVFEYPQVAQDFLPLLRSCHEQTKRSPLWQELRLVMAYSTETYVPLRLNQSPFNIGMSLCLPPFDPQQVNELAQIYGLPRFGATQVSQLMTLLGGQPYLINRAFYAMKEQGISFRHLIETAPTPSGVYIEHLQHYWALILDEPDLISALATVIHQSAEIDTVTAYKLASIGLVKLDGYRVDMSCDLYRLYFERIFSADVLSA